MQCKRCGEAVGVLGGGRKVEAARAPMNEAYLPALVKIVREAMVRRQKVAVGLGP